MKNVIQILFVGARAKHFSMQTISSICIFKIEKRAHFLISSSRAFEQNMQNENSKQSLRLTVLKNGKIHMEWTHTTNKRTSRYMV